MSTNPQSPQGSPSEARGSQSPNRYGVDADYFRRELAALAGTLDNRPADELARYLRRLADAAAPTRPVAEGRPSPGLEEAYKAWLAQSGFFHDESIFDGFTGGYEAALAAPGAPQEEGPAGVDCPTCGLPANADRNPTPWAYQQACRALDRLRAQAPASSPRDLEAVPADGLRMICRSYMYVQAGPLRDAANWIARVLAAKDFPQETEAWKRAHPPKGETPSEAAGLQKKILLELEAISAQREEIGRAFLAKYGCAPEEVEQVIQHTAEGTTWFVRRLRPAPGTPIEKAAREALAELEAACNIVERHGGEDILIEYIRPRLARARASLSSLPQEHGYRDRVLIGRLLYLLDRMLDAKTPDLLRIVHEVRTDDEIREALKRWREGAQEGAAGEGGAGCA